MDEQGKSKCFYKGYADNLDATLTPQSRQEFNAYFQPCTTGSASCADALVDVRVTGAGVPTHQSWFWASRKVYQQIEPAYWFLISSGTIGPDFSSIQPKMSPGFCDAQEGAVEAEDWRDYASVGLDTTTSIALRNRRSSIVFESLSQSLPGTLPENSGWFLKRIWRNPWTNETLFLSPSTTDAEQDTSPGYYDDSTGSTVSLGPNWRHKLACIPSTNCQSYFIYNDSCKVTRVAQSLTPNPFNLSSWSLSPCAFSNGSSAHLDPRLGEAGLTFNETSYLSHSPSQPPATLGRSWGFSFSLKSLKGMV